MKFILVLACLALYVAYTQAQDHCKGFPHQQDCNNGKDEGHYNGHNCHQNANHRMWWYSHQDGRCHEMQYKGCGGNHNRYCAKSGCERQCS